jgi:endo-1,4-beta-D-glucanase Y
MRPQFASLSVCRKVRGVSRAALAPVAMGALVFAGACSPLSSIDDSSDAASPPPTEMPDAGGGATKPQDSGSAPKSDATTGQTMVSPPPGGDSSAPPTRGPTPASNGVNFPFPQNRQSQNCVYPAGYLNSDVQAAYARWKADTVTTSGAGGFRRVERTASDTSLALNSTVSEGIGYGMLLAVYMNDQSLFDDLWNYEQLHLGVCPPGLTCPDMELMDWNISADGSTALGTGAATDADEDMAFALAMADKQWGGQGALSKSYNAFAVAQITSIWLLEIFQSMFVKPGDWGDNTTLNPSYFAPAYYRVFKTVGGTLPKSGGGSWDPDWDGTIDTLYTTIGNALNATNQNQNNGLVPAWCTSAGAPNPMAIMPGGNATNYQYDSCRTPFRIALDWCLNGEPRAQAYVAKTSSFFAPIGAKQIVDGYGLDGTPQPANPGKLSAAFIGPAGVGAMSSATYQPFVNDAYATIVPVTALAGGAYYEESWTTLSLLMMTANFLDYTSL